MSALVGLAVVNQVGMATVGLVIFLSTTQTGKTVQQNVEKGLGTVAGVAAMGVVAE
jgi:hypothetical protein